MAKVVSDYLSNKKYIDFNRDSYRIIILLSGVACLGYTWKLMTNKDNWKKEGDVSAELNRGKFTSVFSMLTLGIFNMIMNKYAGINGYTSAATMSIFAGNMTGFVMDAALAGKDGWSLSYDGDTVSSANLSDCFKYGFASLLSHNALRYMLTILFDMHISSVFIEGINQMTLIKKLEEQDGPWKTFLPTFLSVIVSLTTFYAYTNQSRFSFAIRDATDDDTLKKDDDTPDQKTYIDTFTMFSLVSIASIVYLHQTVNGGKGVHNVNIKALNVILTFSIMVVMTQFKTVERSNPIDPKSWTGGFAAYALILLGLVSGTFQTSPNGVESPDFGLKWGTKPLMIFMVMLTILLPLFLATTVGNGIISFFVFAGLFALTTLLFWWKGNGDKKNIFRMDGTSSSVIKN